MRRTYMATINIKGQIREATCEEELTAMRDSIELFSGKWKLQLLRYLANRTAQSNHFKKMLREINGISARMLSKELKLLEINFLVTRTVLATKPVTVAYAITSYGQTILPVAENLVAWGLCHREKVKSAISA
ncbi:DNA-binding HxlR family transcriptional regulator [Chitinophaga sp. W3I9]|uniref:winged helix-turn-helix transcriptional regulator n=1 Tax=unclassified Chitinophaga TaxID=2619133 RepID=UPI003D204DE7